MTTSAISQESEKQPRRSRRRKERSQPTLWAIALISFGLGAAASTFTLWQFNKLYKATIAPPVSVEGTLKAQYRYDEKALHPAPTATT